MEIKVIWTKNSLARLELATPWTEPKCLTDWATLPNKDMEILDSCLNNRQEMLHENERYLNKKVIGKARTCNLLGRTQMLNWLSYFGWWRITNNILYSWPAFGRPRSKVTIMARASMLQKIWGISRQNVSCLDISYYWKILQKMCAFQTKCKLPEYYLYLYYK